MESVRLVVTFKALGLNIFRCARALAARLRHALDTFTRFGQLKTTYSFFMQVLVYQLQVILHKTTASSPKIHCAAWNRSNCFCRVIFICEYLNAALKAGGITADSSGVYIAKGSHYWEKYLLLSTSFDLNNRCWITFSNNVFSVVSGHENWPVVYVTWIGAKAFADYYGCDLPREAEWEYACRGGKQYLYGTDDGTLSSNKVNYTGINHPVSVKSYPKNPFGLYDISGNVWELCSDYYGSYSSSPATNPTGPESSEAHIIRGGSWSYFKESTLRSAHRSSHIPEFANVSIGFRVVRR